MIGIYVIENIANRKVYIGRSKDIGSRISSHKHNLRNNIHINKYLQNAWNKYGENNFKFYVLEECNTLEDTYDKEIFYIDKFKSCDRKYGYNLSKGGEGAGLWSEESKEKLSISKRFNNTELTWDDVRRIKLALYCNMDRKEISKMFNISTKVLTQISRGVAFGYINEELNSSIHNLKQKMIDERNRSILKMFDSGLSISEISKITSYSISIVEKCVYKYRNPQQEKLEKYRKIYDEVHKLYNDGYKKYHIYKKLNISPSTVDRYLKDKNNPYKELSYKKITKDIEKELIDMYFNKNISIKDISNDLNASRNTVESYINKYKHANTEIINLNNIS